MPQNTASMSLSKAASPYVLLTAVLVTSCPPTSYTHHMVTRSSTSCASTMAGRNGGPTGGVRSPQRIREIEH
ncbi:hypothetical protein M405DRAFT_544935 [Rhizopogon salebrosus TDB-379]|nr:hypothetical protein M405DRAFT_544935 [Rhizopogon salebrosus TDB-379]